MKYSVGCGNCIGKHCKWFDHSTTAMVRATTKSTVAAINKATLVSTETFLF